MIKVTEEAVKKIKNMLEQSGEPFVRIKYKWFKGKPLYELAVEDLKDEDDNSIVIEDITFIWGPLADRNISGVIVDYQQDSDQITIGKS